MKTNYCRVMGTMALRYTNNVALVNVERGRRCSFPEYHQLTNRVANIVHGQLGLRRGDTALLILDNDNFSLLHFPSIYKQEATFPLGAQMRDRGNGAGAWSGRECALLWDLVETASDADNNNWMGLRDARAR